MDIKITKKRLNDHLSYDWVKYLVFILAAVLLWSLLFTMFKPRIPENKTFNLYVVTPGVNSGELDQVKTSLRNKIDVNAVMQVNTNFLGLYEKNTSQVLQARISIHEGNALITDNVQLKPDATESEIKNTRSNFKGYVDLGVVDSVTDFLAGIDALRFDEQEFRSRVKEEKKFNKIDTEEDMQAAIALEKQRVETIRQEAFKLKCYLGLAEDSRYAPVPGLAFYYTKGEQSVITDGESPVPGETEKIWGLNLAEVRGSRPVLTKIANLLLYGTKDTDTDPREYALGLMFGRFNNPYQYEYVKVLNYFVENYR